MVGLNENLELSIRNQWARQHAVHAIKHGWNKIVDRNKGSAELVPLPRIPDQGPLPKAPRPPKASQPRDPAKAEHRIINIGIVGAGAAGLFTALVLHNLNEELRKKSLPLSFDYDMYEAAGPERVGGRLFTYNFGGAPDVHDYYDVGAMRFPHNPVMKRVFELFNDLGMKEVDLKAHPDAKDGCLITYYMQNGGPDSKAKQPWCYNDITAWGSSYSSLKTEGNDDPFKIAADGSIDKGQVLKANNVYNPG
ncbi:L-amino-acid oxidase [Fusarium albosuccineum]|uniref:L-amino-acid oxidase n=1 Tax=Fusarium albosuccineum TaxID=1237068 RepID=A0A8H4PCQ1_9HYPO|nr:L-amino-acid oxidase [Fusarium albosuccineum]